MCRSIHVLREGDVPAGPEAISEAALQFVRKVSGFRKPSQANAEAFDAAILEVAAATQRLLDSIQTNYPASAKRTTRSAESEGAGVGTPHRHGRGANAIVHTH